MGPTLRTRFALDAGPRPLHSVKSVAHASMEARFSQNHTKSLAVPKSGNYSMLSTPPRRGPWILAKPAVLISGAAAAREGYSAEE